MMVGLLSYLKMVHTTKKPKNYDRIKRSNMLKNPVSFRISRLSTLNYIDNSLIVWLDKEMDIGKTMMGCK